jgi:hypothetical protein
MTIKRADRSNHWGTTFPFYHCSTYKEYKEICHWMLNNDVEHFLWASGSTGYMFDVRTNIEWFELRWS